MSERDSSEFETSEFCLKTETRVSVPKTQEMDFDRTVIPEQIQGSDFDKSSSSPNTNPDFRVRPVGGL